jgi:hypothetical protein
MNVSVPLERLLSAPPLTGKKMLIVSIVAVAVPTAFRAVVDGGQGDLCLYLPFVTLAAMVLDWRTATAVAVVSGFLANSLFVVARHQLLGMGCGVAGLIYFGIASILIIGFAQAFRKTVADPLWLKPPSMTPMGVVFSRKHGQACVSWHGGRSFVPLGQADEVEEMMRDFLAQQEVGRRLIRQNDMRGASS